MLKERLAQKMFFYPKFVSVIKCTISGKFTYVLLILGSCTHYSRKCLFFGFLCSPRFLPQSSSNEQLGLSFSPVGGKILLGNQQAISDIRTHISLCSTCVALTLIPPSFGHESTRSTRDLSRRWTSSRWCRSITMQKVCYFSCLIDDLFAFEPEAFNSDALSVNS